MGRSEALKEAQKRYAQKLRKSGKVPLKNYSLKLHKTHDADIIEFIDGLENKSGFIKELIRASMHKRS